MFFFSKETRPTLVILTRLNQTWRCRRRRWVTRVEISIKLSSVVNIAESYLVRWHSSVKSQRYRWHRLSQRRHRCVDITSFKKLSFSFKEKYQIKSKQGWTILRPFRQKQLSLFRIWLSRRIRSQRGKRLGCETRAQREMFDGRKKTEVEHLVRLPL